MYTMPSNIFFEVSQIRSESCLITFFSQGIFIPKSKERQQLKRTAPQFVRNKISLSYVIRLPLLLGIVSVIMIFVNRQLTNYPRYIRGVWAVFTVAVVLMPSVGSTWQR